MSRGNGFHRLQSNCGNCFVLSDGLSHTDLSGMRGFGIGLSKKAIHLFFNDVEQMDPTYHDLLEFVSPKDCDAAISSLNPLTAPPISEPIFRSFLVPNMSTMIAKTINQCQREKDPIYFLDTLEVFRSHWNLPHPPM